MFRKVILAILALFGVGGSFVFGLGFEAGAASCGA